MHCVPAPLLLLLQAVRTPLGAFQQVTVCNRCEGQGQSFQACERCGGDGRERESKRIQLTVPAGVWGALDTSCWAGRRQESLSVKSWLCRHSSSRSAGWAAGCSCLDETQAAVAAGAVYSSSHAIIIRLPHVCVCGLPAVRLQQQRQDALACAECYSACASLTPSPHLWPQLPVSPAICHARAVPQPTSYQPIGCCSSRTLLTALSAPLC